MSHSVENFVANNRETMETVLDFLVKGAELVFSTLQMEFPAVEAVVSLVQTGLNCVESKELTYIKDKFQIITNKLTEISSGLEKVRKELEKMEIDDEFSNVEENIHFQFKNLTDMLNAKPERREWRQKQFITDYTTSPAENDLERLYSAVAKEGMRKESLLVFVKKYMDLHRRDIQDYYTHLMKLFYVGLIVTMAFRQIKGDNTERLEATWKERIKGIESQMKAVIDECTNKFQQQAKTDIEDLVTKKYNKVDQSNVTNQELANEINDFLKEKYDWVCWSIHVYELSSSCFPFSMFNANYDDMFGNNWLPISPAYNTPGPKIAVSFCIDPKPIDKQKIQSALENLKKKPAAEDVAKYISRSVPEYVVHIVSQNKAWAFACSFPDGYHYYERTQYVNICIHSDQLAEKE